MDNLIRKKIVLSLLDSEPKPANEIDESLTTIICSYCQLLL